MTPKDKNKRVIMTLLIPIAIMIGLVVVSEPLYRVFCQATGYNGTTQRTAQLPVTPRPSKDRIITVRLDGNVDPSLPWEFGPEQASVKVKVGEAAHVTYRARNKGATTVTGTAVHNVQPDKAGLYFNKTQCFCFTKQTLKAGESEELPVEFFIDPSINDDQTEDDVTTITLSYTFYSAKNQGKNTMTEAISPDATTNP